MINQVEAQNILQDFLRIESVTPDAKKSFDFLEKLFKKYNFEIHRVKFGSADTIEVENMFAIIGSGGPHLNFAGHVDVVPPGELNSWKHPPFSGHIEDGIIYARGAEDMKGAVIASIVAGINYYERMDSKGTLSYMLTGDEEGVAINGTKPLIKWVNDQGIKINDCIVTEPTNKELIGDNIKIGRRGSLSCDLRIIGKQGHVAYPEKAKNPITHAIKALSKITGQLDEGSEHFLPTNIEITSIDVNNPTHNIIPELVHVSLNVRFNDLWNEISLIEYIKNRLSSALDEAEITFDLRKISVADVYYTGSGKLTDLLQKAIFNKTNIDAKLSTFGGTSDGRFIAKYCPVVEFGLVGRTMHQVDEKIRIDDFFLLTEIYIEFIDNYFNL
ncbi:MAG: succinyl-diaminopimelate desuccinylase [Rhodobiaceae bacterium]|nr:succinyl-diaminopimelate desuccinylase [Rhodobiaceae bacterium]MEC7090320.1 succinyl-diaminopimelate desuccinylase [Pseudomonadota bacterium]MEC7927724.1 succinyl-diaminopimelate desuccinylase [Pseudomonadota bacterium]|tara:strand:+ start:5824 stop:6981 length:1158 start_codon:yes stop_codon:yes gene_type:complete